MARPNYITRMISPHLIAGGGVTMGRKPVVTCAITGCGATTLWPPEPPPTGSPAWGDLPGIGRLCPTCSARLFPAASRGL